MQELLQLPWQIQIVIVSGYLSYRVAYAGRSSAHRATDIVAIILCFGGVALAAFEVIHRQIDGIQGQAIASAAAIIASLLSAAIWRRFVSGWANYAIKAISRSQEDGYATAWDTIVQKERLLYSQLNLTLTNGDIYESYPLGRFNKWSNGPCVLGGDGSVAMYVTHITPAGGTRREVNLLETEEGKRITYVPSGSIREIDLRRERR